MQFCGWFGPEQNFGPCQYHHQQVVLEPDVMGAGIALLRVVNRCNPRHDGGTEDAGPEEAAGNGKTHGTHVATMTLPVNGTHFEPNTILFEPFAHFRISATYETTRSRCYPPIRISTKSVKYFTRSHDDTDTTNAAGVSRSSSDVCRQNRRDR